MHLPCLDGGKHEIPIARGKNVVPSTHTLPLQVNTSGEASKFGIDPSAVLSLTKHITAECPHLKLAGLMTIGQPDYSSRPENFTCLVECRTLVAEELGVEASSLELSMGMSSDFEQAIEMGSTNVRVGSTIFGARDYSQQ
jgi:PLP dependent protein